MEDRLDRPHVVSFNGELDIWKEANVEETLSVLDGSAPAVVDLSAVQYSTARS